MDSEVLFCGVCVGVYSPGPHIPDSPGTGSVSVFFVDPSGKPSNVRTKNGSS